MLTVGACAVAGLVNVPVSQAATGDPVAFTGEIDTEIPLDRALFTLRVDLPATQTADLADGEEVEMLKLPTTGISTSGRAFSIAADPHDVPARYIGSNDLVSMELEIYDPKTDSYAWTTQSVRLVGEGGTGAARTAGSASASSWANPLAGGQAGADRSFASGAPRVKVHS
ncbi:hypothetical protein [Streptomyces sp. NPDC054940]